MRIPAEYWDENRGRWNSHAYFKTINHHHISCYDPAPGRDTCDIMIVECEDGRWYIEDNWGEDAPGEPDVFNPFSKDSYPVFFSGITEAGNRAAEIVSKISGVAVDPLSDDDE